MKHVTVPPPPQREVFKDSMSMEAQRDILAASHWHIHRFQLDHQDNETFGVLPKDNLKFGPGLELNRQLQTSHPDIPDRYKEN